MVEDMQTAWPSLIGGRAITCNGEPLEPGVNLDVIDVGAGLRAGITLGYDDPTAQMVLEYALMRHRRGEEDGAERSALSGGIDFTSWRVVLASAMAAKRR